MTVEAFTPAPPLTVAGIGPYAVPHPYTSGSLSVVVEKDGARTTLGGGDWSVTPAESATAGSVYLAPAAATLWAGGTLYTLRSTPAEQGWQGVQGERERSLELQLDRLAMLAQEAQAGLAAALRVATGTPVIVPGLDRTIVWTEDGFVAGPSTAQIEAAAGNADLARRWASEAQGTPVVPGQFSAFHWAQIALAAALAGGPPLTRTISAGTGLTGGGDLSANRTLALTGNALQLHQLGGTDVFYTIDGSGNVTAVPKDAYALHEPGTFVLTGMPTSEVPYRTLRCTGAAISRTVYGALFAKIGTAWGAGDGATTFNIPDARGRFPRGFDDGAGRDPGRVFGTYQLDALQQMTGTLTSGGGRGGFANAGNTGVFGGQGTTAAGHSDGTNLTGYRDIAFDASLVARTAAETRVVNFTTNIFIRY